jgi:hypothetical protein
VSDFSKLRGKTVARVQAGENHDGWPTTIVQFIDGTALQISAYSQEEADQSTDLIDTAEADSIIAEFDRREQERAARQAEIDAFNALPQDEQDRIRAERRAAMHPLERMIWDEIQGDLNRGVFYQAGEITISDQLLPKRARRS